MNLILKQRGEIEMTNEIQTIRKCDNCGYTTLRAQDVFAEIIKCHHCNKGQLVVIALTYDRRKK